MRQLTEARAVVPAISTPLLILFRTIVRRYFRRQFHAVRVVGAHHLSDVRGPLIVYANHSSWWDPMVCFLLSAELLPQRRNYAPMEADSLDRYAVLKQLGVFPVAIETARGAVQFLRTGQAVLESGGVLWITPQGRFADRREKPLTFKPGLATLAARVGRCTVLPLAIEYTFWDERKPEVLLEFAEPVEVDGADAATLGQTLVEALAQIMTRLEARALTRDPGAFERVLAKGAVGTGGMYGLGQRLRAAVLRRPYQAEHTRKAVADSAASQVLPDRR